MDKPTSAELAVRILALVRLDAQRLYERIKFRAPEYLTIYSVKRTRDHFAAVFKNRYDEINIEDLKFCDESVIYALDAFYSAVDKLRWYLYTTEDMPSKVDNRVHSTLKELRKDYDDLIEAIDAQQGIASKSPKAKAPTVDENINQVVFEEIPVEDLTDTDDIDEDDEDHETEVKPVLFDVVEDLEQDIDEDEDEDEEEDEATSPSLVMEIKAEFDEDIEDEAETLASELEEDDDDDLEYSLDPLDGVEEEDDDDDDVTSPSISFHTKVFPNNSTEDDEDDDSGAPEFDLDSHHQEDEFATIPELIPEKKKRTRIAGPEFDETPLKSKAMVKDIETPDKVAKVQKDLPGDFVNDFTLQFELNEDEEDVATVVRPNALAELKKVK